MPCQKVAPGTLPSGRVLYLRAACALEGNSLIIADKFAVMEKNGLARNFFAVGETFHEIDHPLAHLRFADAHEGQRKLESLAAR